MAIIFHITTREAWDKATAEGTYRTQGLPVEGFIHCSTREQVVRVANFRFRGQTGLVLLAVNTDRVKAEIRYEDLAGEGQKFPHIYGELNTDAVAQVVEFEPDTEGYFALPAQALRIIND